MAKLIKSILANRMMFRGGGLVAPGHAGGILASSSPLIDSVTMNQGGPVNFMNGGIATAAPPEVLERSSQVPSPISGTWGFPPDVARFDPLSQNALSGQDIWPTPSEQMIERKNAQWNQRRKQVTDKLEASIPEYLSKGADQQEAFSLALNDLSEQEKALIGQEAAPDETVLPPGQPIEPDAEEAQPSVLNIAQNAEAVTVEYLSNKTVPTRQPPRRGYVRGDWRKGPYAEDTSFDAIREQNPYTPLIGKTKEDFPRRRGGSIAERTIRKLDSQGMTAEQASAAWNDSAYQLFSDTIGVKHTTPPAGGGPAADPELTGDPLGRGGFRRDFEAKGKNISAKQQRLDAHTRKAPYIYDKPVEVQGRVVLATHGDLMDWVGSGEANADAESTLIDTLLEKIGGRKEEDIDDIKGTIEALMPAAEKSDDKTLGLLLARFGAALMATPGNFLEAVGKVGNDHIGDFINYQEGIKEKERERELAISKLAITEKLSRDKEGRDLTTYVQKGIIDEEIKGLTPKNYMLPSQFLSATVFDPDASPDDIVNIPGSIMPFNELSAQKLEDAGVSMIALDDLSSSFDYADFINLVGGATGVDVGDENEAAELINRFGKNDTKTLLKGHMNKGDGVEVDSYLMTPAGAQQLGMSGRIVLDRDMHAFTVDVHRANSKIGALMSLVNTLDNIKHSDLVGVGLFKGNLKSALRGFSEGAEEGSIRNQIAHAIAKATGVKELYDPEGKPTGQKLYEVNARFLMTQIAPMLLGESGKTISDADRVLVAQALGWRGAHETEGGVFQLGDYDATYLKDASVIQASIDLIKGALQKHQASLLSEYGKFARSVTIASSADTRGLFSKNWKKHTQSGSDYFDRMKELTGGIEQAAKQIFTTDINEQGDQFSIVQDYTI